MKISVITAVYNRVATVGHAMVSIQAQTYPNVEHVVQDGGSTDGTLDVLTQLAIPSTYVRSEPDKGIYDAINRGLARATGDVVGFMHSDDFYADDCVLECVAEAFADPDVDGVYGDLQYVAVEIPHGVVRHWRSGEYSRSKLGRGWMPPHPTLYLRRAVLDRWGLYDTNYQIAADYDAMLRYLVRGQIKLAYIPDVLVKMRVGGESNRSLSRVLLKSLEDLRAIRRNGVGGLGTLACKNLRKIPQFFQR
jgi:glycosyltransferase involved in cell wall biosynthesis